MSVRDDAQITLYPFVKYKEWKFIAYPSFKEDAEKQLQRIQDFNSREDDVLFCTSPKSGTHWIGEVMCMLLYQTTKYNSIEANLKYHLDFCPNYDHLEEETQQRLLHTHLPFSLIPTKHKQKRAKIVYTNRNPKDRHVSQYLFFRGLIGTPQDWTWDEYFDELVRNDTFLTGWFNYTREMTAAVQNKANNVHQVLYEDMLINPISETKKIAEFLEVPYNDDFINQIVEKCKFKNLKEHKLDGSKPLHREGKSTIFRKGVIGDWKDWFTVAQNEEFDAMYKREMEGVDVQFTYEMPNKD